MGGAVRCLRSVVRLRNCVIRRCEAEGLGGGLYAEDSDIVMESCKIVGCSAFGGGGVCLYPSVLRATGCEFNANIAGEGAAISGFGASIRIEACSVANNSGWQGCSGISCSSPALTIRDCVIYNNRQTVFGAPSALDIRNAVGVVAGCTIVANLGWNAAAPVMYFNNANITVEAVIVAMNNGRAVQCDWCEPTFQCGDWYANSGGDGLCGVDLGGNFSADPLFCDAPNADYTLDGNSPCLPGHNHGGVDCGLIGARGAGCGVPTGACCFADGSCRVSSQADCATQHGSYQGDGTVCDPNPCHPTPVRVATWGRIKGIYR